MSRLVVDGYNIVHAWPDLAACLRRESLEEARRRLVERLGEYRASTGNEVTVVFDARFRVRGTADQEVIGGVEVRYGSSRESADHVIERLMYEGARRGRSMDLLLATDDRLQRGLVAGMGVPTISARALLAEVERAERERTGEMRRREEGVAASDRIESRIDPEVRRRLEAIRRGEAGGSSSGEGLDPGAGRGRPPGSSARR